jgi:hypothetical protein
MNYTSFASILLCAFGVCSCSTGRVDGGLEISFGRAHELGLPIVGIHNLVIHGTAVHTEGLGTGELLVYKAAGNMLWYRVKLINGSPIGQLIEYNDKGDIMMISIYESPGSTKTQVYFTEDGKVKVL